MAFTPFRFFKVDIMKAMKAMKAMLVSKGLGYYRNVFPPSLFRWARLNRPHAEGFAVAWDPPWAPHTRGEAATMIKYSDGVVPPCKPIFFIK